MSIALYVRNMGSCGVVIDVFLVLCILIVVASFFDLMFAIRILYLLPLDKLCLISIIAFSLLSVLCTFKTSKAYRFSELFCYLFVLQLQVIICIQLKTNLVIHRCLSKCGFIFSSFHVTYLFQLLYSFWLYFCAYMFLLVIWCRALLNNCLM